MSVEPPVAVFFNLKDVFINTNDFRGGFFDRHSRSDYPHVDVNIGVSFVKALDLTFNNICNAYIFSYNDFFRKISSEQN